MIKNVLLFVAGAVTALAAVALYLGHSINERPDTVSSPAQSESSTLEQISDVVEGEAAPTSERDDLSPEGAAQPNVQATVDADQAIAEDQQSPPSEARASPTVPANTSALRGPFEPLAQQFASENRDQNRSSAMEGQILAYYSDFGVAANLVEVECRTTLCRVALTLPEMLPRETPLIVENDDGRPVFAVGEELGMDTIFIFRGQDPNGAYVFRSYLRFDSTPQSISDADKSA